MVLGSPFPRAPSGSRIVDPEIAEKWTTGLNLGIFSRNDTRALGGSGPTLRITSIYYTSTSALGAEAEAIISSSPSTEVSQSVSHLIEVRPLAQLSRDRQEAVSMDT